jgi:hypothetical protein
MATPRSGRTVDVDVDDLDLPPTKRQKVDATTTTTTTTRVPVYGDVDYIGLPPRVGAGWTPEQAVHVLEACANRAGDERDPYFYVDRGACPYTCDPVLKHMHLTVADFFNYADARYADAPPDAAATRAAFARGPFTDEAQWPTRYRARKERRPRSTHDIDYAHLASLVRLFRVPTHAKPFEDEVGSGVPRAKVVDTLVADWRRRREMLHVAQGRPAWHEIRAGGWGSSTKGTLVRLDHFATLEMARDADTAQRARDVEYRAQLYPRFYGNWVEDSVSWKQAYILGVFIVEVGMQPDPVHPWFKSSPDRLCLVPPWLSWSRCMPHPPLRIMQEDKGPLYAAYLNHLHVCALDATQRAKFASLLHRFPYPHRAPPHYLPQLLEQMHVFDAPLNLFTYDWQCNDLAPMRRVRGTDVFLVSSGMVLMVYANAPLNAAYLDVYNEYVREVMHANGHAFPEHLHIPRRVASLAEAFDAKRRAEMRHLTRVLPINCVSYYITGELPRDTKLWSAAAVDDDVGTGDFVGARDFYTRHAAVHDVVVPTVALPTERCARLAAQHAAAAAAAQRVPNPHAAYACRCCDVSRTDASLHLGVVPWNEVRWVRRRVTDRNVGARPTEWRGAWPPYMGIALRFYPDAQPVDVSVADLEAMERP